MKSNGAVFKKLHRWPGLIISFILLYYGFTGIIMNHREAFSPFDLPMRIMPSNYEYRNWNNAALKGNLVISPDSILVYGNIGIWLTDSSFTRYSSMNEGFPSGSDNNKISDLYRSPSGHLYAATLFGLYAYKPGDKKWTRFGLENEKERFTAVTGIGDTVIALSRSALFSALSSGTNSVFTRKQLPAPEGYVNDVTMFQTLWQIHSGEIFGLPGKLLVDILGIITIFLSVTGIIYFFFPDWIKRRARLDKPYHRLASINKWSLSWHNKIGAWTFILLIILFFTGMFLRPPLLIAIGNSRVAPIKFSHLDQPNPWYDKLRDIIYDTEKDYYLISTSEGIFKAGRDFGSMIPFPVQPPVSVMGINSFEKTGSDVYLVGSFSGLFSWNPFDAEILDLGTGKPYVENSRGIPVGDLKVTGTIRDLAGRLYIVEYENGIIPAGHDGHIYEMPDEMKDLSKISLWNAMLEIHTGRIFQKVTGMFYILIVPLAGITGITVVISGYMVWRRKYRKKNS
jgi:hypothetical protein